MRVGISSYTYSWNIGVAGYPAPPSPMRAIDLLTQAKQLGAQVLQIADNLPLDRLGSAELYELSSIAAEWRIQLEVGTRGVRSEVLLPYLDIAEKLRAPLVRTLLHDGGHHPSIAEARNDLLAVLPALREKRLILAVENHDLYPAQQLRELIESIADPHIGICLDPVNNLAQGESAHDVFAALGEYTFNFHCKDFTITRKTSNLGFDVEGCPVGAGLLNLPQCSRRLGGRDMSYIVELWTPWRGDIHSTCRLEREWAEQSAARLLEWQHAGSDESGE